MDLVDLNLRYLVFYLSPLLCRDPCGSRGSKLCKQQNMIQAERVEILVDLVDLNRSENCMEFGL